jgi:hypothetical protein
MFKHWFKKRALHEARGSAWPPLPTNGFVLGRAATTADIDLGDAVFSQASNDGLEAEHYPIAIPQYALWQDEDGSTHRVFVVQAEKHLSDPSGEPIYGLRTFDGEKIVVPGGELQLLGAVLLAT